MNVHTTCLIIGYDIEWNRMTRFLDEDSAEPLDAIAEGLPLEFCSGYLAAYTSEQAWTQAQSGDNLGKRNAAVELQSAVLPQEVFLVVRIRREVSAQGQAVLVVSAPHIDKAFASRWEAEQVASTAKRAGDYSAYAVTGVTVRA